MRTKLIYGLAAVGALWTAWTAYELAVPEPTDILPERLSDPDSTPLAAVLAASLGESVEVGNRVVPLTNGDEIFPAMLDAIREARESISFLTYIYWTGEIARDFAAELSAACDRGVEVRILLDAVGAYKMDDALVERMEAAGCRVELFRPIHWYTVRRFNNRTHRRALVVDGRVGF
ncbi:MAG TPA: phospholipase D-like domain-containing protein, partial [Gemmatimonadota bacterium]|nr:phospholipase D-like domain-containing protein [Gemmatimonadota bacterium]